MPRGVGANWPWQLVKPPWAEEMTQLIGCLLHRLKDLSEFRCPAPSQKARHGVLYCNPVGGRGGRDRQADRSQALISPPV